ncbi:MAG: hypothetical protein ACKVTZ_16760 [Bacteroidia bacterium]
MSNLSIVTIFSLMLHFPLLFYGQNQPPKLNYIALEGNQGNGIVSWSISNLKGKDKVIVLRSLDKKQFVKIAETTNERSAIDKNVITLAQGKPIFYQFKIVTENGKVIFLPISSVNVSNQAFQASGLRFARRQRGGYPLH